MQQTKNFWPVVKQLLTPRLFVKLEKCVFRIEKILFLEFLFITEQVKMELNKVFIIAEW